MSLGGVEMGPRLPARSGQGVSGERTNGMTNEVEGDRSRAQQLVRVRQDTEGR